MPAKDPARASENAKLAALDRWSKVRNRTAATQPARDGLRAKFDPGPDVPEPQRSKMIEAGFNAHMIRMRRASAEARARRRSGAAESPGQSVTA